MSLVHLEKSVLTFHFREILEGGHVSHPLIWVGLGIMVLGPKLLPNLDKTSQSTASIKKVLPPSRQTEIPLSQWVAEAKRREMSATASSRVVDAEVRRLSMFN